jgi:hypothetical protein
VHGAQIFNLCMLNATDKSFLKLYLCLLPCGTLLISAAESILWSFFGTCYNAFWHNICFF